MSAQDDNRSRLSALMDGQADADELAGVGARWRTDADLRATWHTYHLIGDVLRSDDLAAPAAHDEVFLQALRARLATEPVVLAPAAVADTAAAATVRRRPWLAPAAAAAGFVVVAGVMVVLRSGQGVGAPPVVISKAQEPAAPRVLVDNPGAAQPILVNGAVLRDARLDRYLEAHRRLGAGAALAVPVAQPVEAIAIDGK